MDYVHKTPEKTTGCTFCLRQIRRPQPNLNLNVAPGHRNREAARDVKDDFCITTCIEYKTHLLGAGMTASSSPSPSVNNPHARLPQSEHTLS